MTPMPRRQTLYFRLSSPKGVSHSRLRFLLLTIFGRQQSRRAFRSQTAADLVCITCAIASVTGWCKAKVEPKTVQSIVRHSRIQFRVGRPYLRLQVWRTPTVQAQVHVI